MSRIPVVDINQLDPEMQSILAAGEEYMGFSANDGLLMAYNPEMLKAILSLVQSVYNQGDLPLGLKKLVAVMTSSASGCQYCEVHTQFGAMSEGIGPEKLEAIWEYQTSELFTDAERAALDVARSAALSPNETSDESFARLKRYYSDKQIIELVGVIAMFGFLNRWNSTLATDLEQIPKAAVQASGLLNNKS